MNKTENDTIQMNEMAKMINAKEERIRLLLHNGNFAQWFPEFKESKKPTLHGVMQFKRDMAGELNNKLIYDIPYFSSNVVRTIAQFNNHQSMTYYSKKGYFPNRYYALPGSRYNRIYRYPITDVIDFLIALPKIRPTQNSLSILSRAIPEDFLEYASDEQIDWCIQNGVIK